MGRINVTFSIFAELCAPTTDHVLKTDDVVILTLLLADTYSGAHKVCGQKYPDALS